MVLLEVAWDQWMLVLGAAANPHHHTHWPACLAHNLPVSCLLPAVHCILCSKPQATAGAGGLGNQPCNCGTRGCHVLGRPDAQQHGAGHPSEQLLLLELR